MASSRPSSLTALQRDLVEAFFRREQRLFLTGGAALAGYYFGHRTTEDLDLFSAGPGLDLADAVRAMTDAAAECGGRTESVQTHPDFRRLRVTRGEDICIVDLVIDRAPAIEEKKELFGAVRVDTLREITANKICTLLSRSEIKDLVDLEVLLGARPSLEGALDDASKKDAGVEPETLAWVLDQVSIGSDAALPGGVAPADVDSFRRELVKRLRAIAFAHATRST